MKKKRGKKLQINFSNRWIYTFVLMGLLIVVAVGVNALTAGITPNPGHAISELGVPANCNNSAIIWNGTNVICSNNEIWEYRNTTIGGYISTSGESTKTIHQKVISIGDWNMDSTSVKWISYGGSVDWNYIVSASVIIYSDSNALNRRATNLERGGYWEATPSADNWMMLTRTSGGTFDSTDFDSTSYNRGWIVINYY